MTSESPGESALRLITGDIREDEPGVAVALVAGADVVQLAQAGLSRLTPNLAFTRKTRARIASISKPMAAQVILTLVQHGQLQLDATLGTYLPELPKAQSDVTLRQLLSMKSGLREEFALLCLAMGDRVANDHDLIDRNAIFDRQTTLNFEPGTRTLYCNTNYALLQRVAERVTGKGFGHLLQEVVFEPANMITATLGNRNAIHLEGIGLAYRKDADWFSPYEYAAEATAAGGVVASLDDLIAWHLWNRRDPNGLWSAISERQHHADGSTSWYALGVERKTLSGLETVGHAGGLRGWAADYVWCPKRDAAVIVVANRNDINWYERAREALVTYLGVPPDPAATPRLFRETAPEPKWQELYGDEVSGHSIAFAGAVDELRFEGRWMLRRPDGSFCRALGVEPFVFSATDISAPPQNIQVSENNWVRPFLRRGSKPSPDLTKFAGVYKSLECPGRVVVAEINGRAIVNCGPDWPAGTVFELRPIFGGLFRAFDSKTGAPVDLHLLWPDSTADRLDISMSRLVRYPLRRVGGPKEALWALRFTPLEYAQL